MKNENKFPSWLLWVWEHGFIAFSALAILLMVVVIGVGYQFEQRLNDIEQTLARQPPRRYQPPDLDAFKADDVTPPSSPDATGSVYVPTYSHVYHDNGRPYLVEVTLSIRNPNSAHDIFIQSVRYYDTKGKLVKKYVDQVIRLKPLETIEFLIPQDETKGGSGANFMVDWFRTESVDEPIVETVMVGMTGSRAFAFSRSGKPIKTSRHQAAD